MRGSMSIRFVVVLLATCGVFYDSVSAAVEVPDPATLSADERRAAYEQMSEEERAAFRELMRNYYENLSPEQREAAREKAQDRYNKMTPEQRQAAKARAREAFQDLSPEERAAAKEKARERYQNMNPEERKEFREKMKRQRKVNMKNADDAPEQRGE